MFTLHYSIMMEANGGGGKCSRDLLNAFKYLTVKGDCAVDAFVSLKTCW